MVGVKLARTLDARSAARSRCPSRNADSASTTSTDGGGNDGAIRNAFANDDRVSSRPLRANGLNACSQHRLDELLAPETRH